MCPKTTPKSLPDSIGLVIRPEQFLNCKKQECHCVPGNNDPATFTSHQICLSLFERGIDLIPSCASRGNLKKAGSQGGVPVGCETGYKIICFFFWCIQWQEPGLYLYTTWKQNDLHSMAQTQKRTYGLFWRKWKLFCFCKLEQLKIHCQKISKPAFPSGTSVRACLGVNIAGLSDLKL